MHSQCPTCRTVFAVTEEQLDAHHGLVRCGKCRDIFNASWNLVDGDVSSVSAVDSGSSPVPETAPGAPRPSREANARKAMLELLGDVDAETEAQLLEQFQQDTEVERDPLPPVTGYEDDEELQLEIDQAVPHRAVAASESADSERANPPRDSLQLELPAGFSDYDESDSGPQDTASEDEFELKFDTEPETEVAISRPPLELPAPPDMPENEADEEIIIEAPPALWGAFEDEETEENQQESVSAAVASGEAKQKTVFEEFEELNGPEDGDVPPEATATQMRRAALKSEEPRGKPVRVASGDSTSEFSRSSTTLADDVRMVEIPQPRRIKPLYWVIAGVVLLLLILWQLKVFYFDDLAQSSSARPAVVALCNLLGCEVPSRRALKMIQLSGTQVNQHPEVPGALQVTVSLVNRAEFAQELPPLEVTLTDNAGQIVGRRTYRAKEYTNKNTEGLAPNAARNVFIDLAQPANSAVGYEVQLVGR